MTDKVSVRLNPDDLTLGDLEDFEEVTGKSLEQALKPVKQYDDEGQLIVDERGRPILSPNISTRTLVAIVWIVNRKIRPGFTLADARAVKVDELEIEVDADADGEGND